MVFIFITHLHEEASLTELFFSKTPKGNSHHSPDYFCEYDVNKTVAGLKKKTKDKKELIAIMNDSLI